jgi:hypothetical protein
MGRLDDLETQLEVHHLGVALFCNNNRKGCLQRRDLLLQNHNCICILPQFRQVVFFQTQLQKKVILKLEKQTSISAQFFSTCYAINNIFFLWSQIIVSSQPSIASGLLKGKTGALRLQEGLTSEYNSGWTLPAKWEGPIG